MAWNKSHKIQTKDKILTSAAELFTRNGFEKVSIDQVMQHAQLTRGAFYAHFSSKSDLYSQSVVKAATLASNRHLTQCSGTIESLTQAYLSQQHRDSEGITPCPLAFLVSDISQQDEMVRNTYTRIFKAFSETAKSFSDDENIGLQTAAMMIGGLAISKALNDENLSDKLLKACQLGVSELNKSKDYV